jgi:hypothetical protein
LKHEVQLNKAPSTFYVEWAASAETGKNAGNLKINREHEEWIFFFITLQPLVGQGLLIRETSRSHSGTPNSVRLLWTSDQLDEETCT